MKKFLFSLGIACMGLAASAAPQTVTFDFTKSNYGLTPYDGTNNSPYVTVPATVNSGDVKITLEGDDNSWRMWSDGLREYSSKNPSFTVTTTSNYVITAVSYVANSKASFVVSGTQNNSFSGSAASVTFTSTSTGNAAVTSITVTYDPDAEPGTNPNPTPNPDGVETVSFDFPKMNFTNAQDITTLTDSPVTLTFDKGTNSNGPKYYTTGTGIRLYGGNTLTVSVPAGYQMTGIAFTVDASYKDNNSMTANVGNYNSLNWSGNAESVVFTSSGTAGHVRIQTITVKYVLLDSNAVPVPTIDFVNSTNTVSITSTEAGAKIYYTTDGNDPVTGTSLSSTATLYQNAFTINATTTVKAVAEVNGKFSSVATKECVYYATYDGFNAYIAANPTNGAKVNGPITVIYQNGNNLYVKDSKNGYMLIFGSLANFNATNLVNGDVLSYVEGKYSPFNSLPEMAPNGIGEITKGGAVVEPSPISLPDVANATFATLNSYVVVEKVVISKDTKDKTYILTDVDGETATLYNTFDSTLKDIPTDDAYYTIIGFVSTYNQNRQLTPISIEPYEEPAAPGQTATPAISFVNTTNTVSISCETTGAEIYYTLNGNDPDNSSTLYTAPFTISETVTVKAIAYSDDLTPSNVATRSCTYYPTFASYEEFVNANPSNGGKVNGPITAIYQNGSYMYTVDSKGGYMLIYGKVQENQPEVTNGDVLAYVDGTYNPYKGLPEIAPVAFGEITKGGTAVQPVVTTLPNLEKTALNAYIKLENVKLASTSTNNSYTLTDANGVTAVLYNSLSNSSYVDDVIKVPSNGTYNIVGFWSINNDTHQVTPISFELVSAGNDDDDDDNDDNGNQGGQGTLTGESVTYDFTDPLLLDAYKGGQEYLFNEENLTIDGNNKFYNLNGVVLYEDPIALTTVVEEGAQNPTRLWYTTSGSWQYRVYAGATITISAETGYVINGIEFKGSDTANNTKLNFSNTGKYADGAWIANEGEEVTEVVITKTESGNNPYITSITVYYSEAKDDNGSSAVSSLDSDNAPVEYYTISGVKVNNPVKGGLYIIRQGNKSSKAILK